MSAYMTTAEAAQYVGGGISPRTIVAWIHSGRLEAGRDPSKRGRFRITRENLDAALIWMPDESAVQ